MFRDVWEGGSALHYLGVGVALGQGNCWKSISDRIILNFWERKASPCRDLCGSLSFWSVCSPLLVITMFTYHPTLPIKNDRDDGALMNHSVGTQLTIINYSSLSLGQWSPRISDLYISLLRDPLGGRMDSLLQYIVPTRSHMPMRPFTHRTWSFESQIGSMGVKRDSRYAAWVEGCFLPAHCGEGNSVCGFAFFFCLCFLESTLSSHLGLSLIRDWTDLAQVEVGEVSQLAVVVVNILGQRENEDPI